MMARFRILLSKISPQLNEQEIRSLVLMCDVPEGQRARMKDGISLFDNLIKRDIINEHKLDTLKTMLKNLSPKRRDLIREIEYFENGTQEQDDESSTLNSVASLPSTIRPAMRETCCALECPYMVISCYKCGCKISWSYVALTAFWLICFLTLILLWYADVPKISDTIASDKHVKKAGPFILIAIVVAFMACLLSLCYVKKRHIRRFDQNATSARNQTRMQDVRERSVTVDMEDDNSPDTADFENNTYDTSKFEKNRHGTSNIELNNNGKSNISRNCNAGFSTL